MPAGRSPKPEGKAVTRHPRTIESVELGSAPVVKRGKVSSAPPSPAAGVDFSRAEWRKLHLRTREWWLTWLEAPQASQFIGTDWTRLFMIGLPLVEGFNRAVDNGEVEKADKLAGRIMQLERDFGATPEARIRNRWIVRPSGNTPGVQDDDEEKTRTARPRTVGHDPRLALVKGGKAKSG